MKPIVEVKGIYKQYRLGEHLEYLSLRDSITNFFGGRSTETSDLFYALEDINFEINPGESVGILGKNGAGKSTLLKILSKITFPTKGEITMRARVASLLEVGTGFHSELTGRENIYFNGTILGMKKHEINRCFDSIVDFAGVESFLSTPLKRYSSGMSVRLAFVVAAHLEPELMIVDEVLAVGDVEFQKKCIQKMNQIVTEGRTILFVSHNTQMLGKLCDRGILLNKGRMISDDAMDKVIDHYLSQNEELDTNNLTERSQIKSDDFSIYKVELFDKDDHLLKHVRSGAYLKLRIYYSNQDSKLKNFSFNVLLADSWMRDLVCFTSESLPDFTIPITSKGYFEVEIQKLLLLPGVYFLSFYVKEKARHLEYIERAYPVEVIFNDYYGSGLLPSVGTLMDYRINV